MKEIEIHNTEIKANRDVWQKKPILKYIYCEFYKKIISGLNRDSSKPIVEIGSGIGHIKEIINNCITTDLFPNEGVDRIESAYNLSFREQSVSNIILLDVFHHLEYPLVALQNFHTILEKKGRVILFEPYISLLGLAVYGVLHHEPIGLFKKINISTKLPERFNQKYYAAQGNASRIFKKNVYPEINKYWKIVAINRYSAISYLFTGGYSKPQLMPDKIIKEISTFEKMLDTLPTLFATRTLIVLEKREAVD